MAHSVMARLGVAVGDEEGVPGSDVRLTVIGGAMRMWRDYERDLAAITGKSRDQRMPLGRFHRPKP